MMATGLVRILALRSGMLDRPNHRSSHVVPTPRGGGMAVGAVFLVGLFLFWQDHLIDDGLFYAIAIGGFLVGLLGYIDDRLRVQASRKLFIQLLAAGVSVYFAGGLPPVVLGNYVVDFGFAGDVLAFFGLVWLINLFNFMDGTDGILGAALLFYCAGGLILYGGVDLSLHLVLLILAGCVAGFLLWNLPPARIFSGDVGSLFGGLMVGVILLWASHHSQISIWPWLILISGFLNDATYTLIRRWLRGAAVFHAHAEHSYQILARRWHSHFVVMVAYSVINIFWLLPMAYFAKQTPSLGAVLLLVANLPLIFIGWRLGAGTGKI